MSPLRAIKTFCLNDCCAGDTVEHRECRLAACPLHPFRFGHKPTDPDKPARELTDAQIRARQAFADRQKCRSAVSGPNKATGPAAEDAADGSKGGRGSP